MKLELIITPLIEHSTHRRSIPEIRMPLPPYGAGCLKTFLTKNGYEAHITDLSFSTKIPASAVSSLAAPDMTAKVEDYLRKGVYNQDIDEFSEILYDLLPKSDSDIFGFSLLNSYGLRSSLLLAKKVKEKTGKPVVFGGAMMTLYEESVNTLSLKKFFETYSFIDFIITGDGEYPLLKLLQALQNGEAPRGIPGLTCRISGKTMSLACARYDINEAPVPDFSDLPLDEYSFSFKSPHSTAAPGTKRLHIPYQITRGCSQHCAFCNNHLITPRIELKSLEKVLRELSAMKSVYNDPVFSFCESRINNSRVYLEALCDELISSKLNIHWTTPIAACNLDRDLLRKMKQAGCATLSWGIESGSDNVLRLMGKPHTAETAARILKISHEEGISNSANFMFGFPGETDEDLERTVSFIIDNSPYIWVACVFNFILLHKTPVSSDPARFGIENVARVHGEEISYDEIGGKRWSEILETKKQNHKKVMQKILRAYKNRQAV